MRCNKCNRRIRNRINWAGWKVRFCKTCGTYHMWSTKAQETKS